MKDFERIDWKTFNKPPFYQQWLCKDETLKLATFGDKGLCELDKNILSLKDQWDLDNAEGSFLDRIGKVLTEPRNGNSDESYRVILNLRKLLNTNDATVPDIIKAIKYLYSSEIVHIVPDYPAGLIIEHDGEGTPGLNFNRILAEVVAAGVSFSTKELFDFTDELDVTDALILIVRKKMGDSFGTGLKYNGRGKYDGHTLNDTELIDVKYDGEHNYYGNIKYRGRQEIIAESFVAVPFRFGGGITETLIISSPHNFTDNARSITKYNGAAKYNSAVDYSGFGNKPFYDLLQSILQNALSDSEPTADNLSVQINKLLNEHFTTHNRYDGFFKHNAETKYNAAQEVLSNKGSNTPDVDVVEFADDFSIGQRYRRRFDGAYRYNGVIVHNGDVLIPM